MICARANVLVRTRKSGVIWTCLDWVAPCAAGQGVVPTEGFCHDMSRFGCEDTYVSLTSCDILVHQRCQCACCVCVQWCGCWCMGGSSSIVRIGLRSRLG